MVFLLFAIVLPSLAPIPLGAIPSEAAPELTKTVYVTKTGKKYHRAGCRFLKKKGTPIDSSRVPHSKTPCKACQPPR